MTRRQALLLALTAIALTVFSAALSRRDSRDWRASRSRRLLPFAWRDAVRASVTRSGGTVSLFKDDTGQWRLELQDGLSDYLNPNAAESLAALATLAWRERIPGRAAPDPATAVTLDVAGVAGETVSIVLGDVREGLRSAVVDGDAASVYGVSQNLAAFLDWPEERWRSMLLAAPGGGARPKRITIAPAAPEGKTIADSGLAVALEERGPLWIMTSPVLWPADANRLDILLRWIDRLRAESVAAEMTGDPEYFGFTENSAFVEALFATPEGGELRRRVEFGGDAGDGNIYVREAGRSPVFTMPLAALSEISLDVAAEHPEAWRNFFRQRTLDRVGHEMPDRVVVERLLPEPAKLTLARSPDPAAPGWTGTLEENGSSRTFAVDAPDDRDGTSSLGALLTGLASLRVKSFLADFGGDRAPGPDSAKWTAHPAWRYSLFTPDGRELPGLALYAADASGALPGGPPYLDGDPEPRPLAPLPGFPAGAGMAFTVPDRPAVMETFAELSYLLCLPPYRYQSNRLIDSDVKEWTRIEVESDAKSLSYVRKINDVNEQWSRGGERPEPLLDDNNRLVSLLVQLSQLRAEAFVQDVSGDVSKFGLDRPTITAIVYSSPEGADPLFTLSIGGEADASGRRFARLGGDGPVFVVPARIAAGLGAEYR